MSGYDMDRKLDYNERRTYCKLGNEIRKGHGDLLFYCKSVVNLMIVGINYGLLIEDIYSKTSNSLNCGHRNM